MVKDRVLNKTAQPIAAHQSLSSERQPEEMEDNGSALHLKQYKLQLMGQKICHIFH